MTVEIEALCDDAGREVSSEAVGNPSREQILRLQDAMIPLATELPVPGHYFAPGMYARELLVPKGMVIVGKTHRFAHFLMVLKGRAAVVSEFGREELSAGYVGVSQAGVKRVVIGLEDTLFVTVHVNERDSQDLAVIEAEHIVPENLLLDREAREVLQ